MKNIKTRITLSALLTVCMIFTLTPSVAFGAGEGSGSQTTETAVEYCLCTMEKNYETGKKELTPAEEEGYDAYIGQTREIVLAQRTKTGSTYSSWTEIDAKAGTITAEWKLEQKDEYIECISETGTSSAFKKSYRMLKESDDEQAIVTVTVTPQEGDPVSCSFPVNVWDGYNPGFDPDDEDEVIELIQKAEEDETVLELATGGSAVGTIDTNDGRAIYRFRTSKSRFFNFYSVNSDAPCCAYLYSYDSEPPEEMKRDATCEMICCDENGNDNFSISGEDYKNPLEENFESTAYYLIVKYYKSSSTGKITSKCDISSTEGIYDPYLYYTVNEDGSQQEIEVYKGFNYSEKESKYVAEEKIPYCCSKDSDIYMKYLDSKENVKVVNNLAEGRNVIADTGSSVYVLDLSFEKSDDMIFEASIYRDAEGDEWDSDAITGEEFDSAGNAVISLPRNSTGKTYTLRLESMCSSRISHEGGTPDSIVEIPFTALEEGNAIAFTVSSADGASEKTFTVSTVENQPLAIDEISMEYSAAGGEGEEELSSETVIYGADFASDNSVTAYVPVWFSGKEARKLETDIFLTDDNAASDYSEDAAMDAAAKAADTGVTQSYEFSVFDKTDKEKYSRKYKINFKLSNSSSADLRYAYMSWISPEDDSEQSERLVFSSGKGTSASPKTAVIRMPEGMTITNEYYGSTVSAIAKECAVIYYYDEGYIEAGSCWDYPLLGESKSETVKFKAVSQDGKKTVYYRVDVYDYDKAFAKGTVFSTAGSKYKVTKTGSAPEASLVGASTETAVKIGAAVTSGKTSYKITSVGAKAFANKNVTDVTIGSNVKTIGASAFTGARKLKTLKVSTRKLTKAGVKNSLKGSSVTTVKCTGSAAKKSVVNKYKKIFTKSNCGRSVKVK